MFLQISYHAAMAGQRQTWCPLSLCIETVSPEGTFCDTVQIPSGDGDMELI